MTHFKALKWILQYIKGTIDFSLFYGYYNSFDLVGYSDSNWASDMNDRKSTASFVFYIGDTAFNIVQRSNLLSYYLLVKLNM
jgi:hypothetical protein